MSIDTAYLSDVAGYVMNDVDHVLIDNIIQINSFSIERVVGNVYEVQFTVTAIQTPEITNIKLRRADNSVVSNDDVIITIPTNEIVIRHTITISEVIN